MSKEAEYPLLANADMVDSSPHTSFNLRDQAEFLRSNCGCLDMFR